MSESIAVAVAQLCLLQPPTDMMMYAIGSVHSCKQFFSQVEI
jgi:hypothetical protein